jgi:hypothetical protein
MKSSERVGHTEQRNAPAAGIARGGNADCLQYVGVSFAERHVANPFDARIQFKFKQYHICSCPTAEAAARAYDAVACLVPGRKLNFRTTIPGGQQVASASRSRQHEQEEASLEACKR